MFSTGFCEKHVIFFLIPILDNFFTIYRDRTLRLSTKQMYNEHEEIEYLNSIHKKYKSE